MPEGVEVFVIVEQLKQLLAEKVIHDINILSGRYTRHGEPEGFSMLRAILPAKIVDVSCKGKFIYFTFPDDLFVFNTLGMTGSWCITSDVTVVQHARVSFALSTETVIEYLVFSDVRNFGTLKVVQGKHQLDKKLSGMGWDPLKISLPDANFASRLSRDQRTLAEILMDQKTFAGVGNYIKAEALYDAKFSPHRLGATLAVDDWNKLCNSVSKIMQKSLAAKGTTVRDYRDAEGNAGTFQNFLKVYAQDRDPHGNEVVRETTKDGRTTHWVKEVQS